MHIAPRSALTYVMLPGMDGDGRLFARFRKAVEMGARGHQVVVVSYNQLGLSTYAQVEAVVRERVASLGPVVLIAESYSGPALVRLCATPPPNLRAGVLVASFVRRPVWKPPGLVMGALPWVMAQTPPRWALRLALVGPDADPALLEEVRAAISSAPADLLFERLQAIVAVDARASLRDCQLPLLSIRATRDRLLSQRVSRALKVDCPQLIEVAIDGPHLLLQVRPAEVLAELEAFLDGLSGLALGVEDDP